MHTTTIFDTKEGRTYIDTIPFLRDRGFVQIVSSQDGKLNLSIERNPENSVKIQANITAAEALRFDGSYSTKSSGVGYISPLSAGKTCEQHKTRYEQKPWWTDVINTFEDFKKFNRNDSVRGDNRLLIDIREPGNYYVTIPNDCDINVELQFGNITYVTPPKSHQPMKVNDQSSNTQTDTNYVDTKLYIKGNSVNICGDSGSSIPPYQSWSYYWGRIMILSLN